MAKAIQFFNAKGQMLCARLDLPQSEPTSFALFAHCFTCSKHSHAASGISNRLSRLGLGVMRLDFTGLGQSQGEFSDTSLSSNVDDLIRACRFLGEHYRNPSLIVGHSFGGVAAIVAASKLDSLQAVACIAAPSDSAHVRHLFSGEIEKIEQDGEAEVSIAGRAFRLKKQFLEDVAEAHVEKALRHLRKPIMIFHAPGDRVVGIEHAARLYAMAKHPKSFVSLDQADHLLSDRRDSTFVADVLAAWSTRYVSDPLAGP